MAEPTVDEALALVATLERDGRYDAWQAAHVLADEVVRLRNDRRNARGFVEAMRARGSMPFGTYTALMAYLDGPNATTGGA